MQEIAADEFARILHHYKVCVQGYGKVCRLGYEPVAGIVAKMVLRVGSAEPGAGRTDTQDVNTAFDDSQHVAHIGRNERLGQ